MKILAVSTSGKSASVAIYIDGKISEIIDRSGKTHSETIAVITKEILNNNSLSANDIDAFAVDVGPGSFTGVRIGVAFINALAFATGKKIYSVSSLEALMMNCKENKSICSLIDARNANGYGALFECGEETIEPTAVVVEKFLYKIPENTVLVGDGAEKYSDLINNMVKNSTISDDNELSAKGVVEYAVKYKKELLDEVKPMYLKPSQAERMKVK